MKRLKVLGLICLMGVGCSYNHYTLPGGRGFTRVQWFQQTELRGFEMSDGTNTLKVSVGSNKSQPEVIEAVAAGVAAGVVKGAKP